MIFPILLLTVCVCHQKLHMGPDTWQNLRVVLLKDERLGSLQDGESHSIGLAKLDLAFGEKHRDDFGA